MQRSETLQKATSRIQDILIIGSGINGAVSAACLAANGYSVTLIDKNDFASATSQESSNLIWGGIKYLENYEISLVRHLCMSRNELMSAFPSQIKEIRFFATHSKKDTHRLSTYWLGCWFYWLLGNGFTKRPKIYSRSEINKIEECVNIEGSDGAIEYSDSYLPDNDARFVYKFAQSAQSKSANIINYCEALTSNRKNEIWGTHCRDRLTGKEINIQSKVILNCGGPYADQVNQRNNIETKYNHVLSKGIHLIVSPIQKTNCVLTFLSDDKRPFYVIPMKNCSCIGTTDTRSHSPNVKVTNEEREFVLDNINKRVLFAKKLTKADIIGERCGVRPLALEKTKTSDQDWFAISRHHIIEKNDELKSISIFGGKLTDCLNVADEIYQKVYKWLPQNKSKIKKWYGDPQGAEKINFFKQSEPFLSQPEIERLWRRYGTHAYLVFEILKNTPNASQKIFEKTEYCFYDFMIMVQTENIEKLEDILRRRTELSLTVRQLELKESQNLLEVCKLIFPNDYAVKWQEYFEKEC
jgi:glycerol-3-phosphate dehydrogenase